MQSVENTRRELFEDTFKKKSLSISLEKAVDSEGDCIYTDDWAQLAWIGFNTALDSVVIELPLQGREYDRADEYYNMGIVHCMDAIESTNLGLKVE